MVPPEALAVRVRVYSGLVALPSLAVNVSVVSPATAGSMLNRPPVAAASAPFMLTV